MSASEFRSLLAAGDVRGLRAYWAKVSPQLPQLRNDEEAEIAMHMARTSAKSIPLKLRVWSHRWLVERMLPSQLPDALRARAERMYPVVRDAVGISVNFSSALLAPAALEIRSSMEDAVEDAYAEGRTDPGFVTSRMQEARARTTRALFGR